jgi:hypothetical protein
MPTNRRRRARPAAATRITAGAIAAWKAGDYMDLHRALALRPWEPSPLDVNPERPPQPDGRMWTAAWPLVAELRRELLRLVGPPGAMDRHGRPLRQVVSFPGRGDEEG